VDSEAEDEDMVEVSEVADTNHKDPDFEVVVESESDGSNQEVEVNQKKKRREGKHGVQKAVEVLHKGAASSNEGKWSRDERHYLMVSDSTSRQ